MERSAFHKLLAFGLERGASDLHFEIGYPPHYRVHGELLSALKVPPLTAQDTESIARMILEERGITLDVSRRFTELDVTYALAQRGRFRASIFMQRGAVGLVIRLIPIQVPSLEELHLPRVVAELASTRRGLVLVTGATGHGKTTTMAAMVRHINETRHAHVVTIEEPIEFLHEPARCLIVQREVGSDTGSFHEAMSAALRQDPDVIAIGALRDRETAAMALGAAENDLCVLAGMHAPDAVSTLRRFLELLPAELQGSARERLAGALQGIVSLRLVPGDGAGDRAGAGDPGGDDNSKEGGRRRVPVAEVFRATRATRDAIRAGRFEELPELIRDDRERSASQSFDQHLQELARRGVISKETALSAAARPDDLERALRADE
ncbi:MAG TPA: PilT/PilU family type 4a pilus ATPase [Kofleriaceae bacterium]|nr:PilT/PilU family type 4a pilus ATPase [Kofleriaceae bacterium]